MYAHTHAYTCIHIYIYIYQMCVCMCVRYMHKPVCTMHAHAKGNASFFPPSFLSPLPSFLPSFLLPSFSTLTMQSSTGITSFLHYLHVIYTHISVHHTSS